MNLSTETQSQAATGDAPPVAGPSCQQFDECFQSRGKVREHWQPLLASLNRLGCDELEARGENSRRILAEHGVTCFTNRDKGGADEPWQLDLLPFILDASDWQALETGLIQRARLLNLVLCDLYGTQRLVRNGFVPAPLIFANPGYLRTCQAIRVQNDAYLHLYAADLGRAADGRWWVLADRTQAPAGLGFALENRSVLSRVLPEAFQDLQPRPLSDTLNVLHNALPQLAPQTTDLPSVVLLTPGCRNEGYFEHAYLSRLLGLTLVEGDDLTVRNRRLFIKTLNGLRRADLVLRRVSDAFCDPLELRGDSLLGVPGLVEAARAGTVGIGNALGTGLLESPAFLPFLPGLCRQLLGEDLRLPSLATWWCGQMREQSYLEDHFEELDIRAAFNVGAASIQPGELSATRRAELLKQARQRPHEFVGQERIRLSPAPVWLNRQFVAKPVVLRAFVLHDGRDFTVVAGCLARVVDDDRSAAAPLPLNRLSKDVWVLPDGEASRNVVEVHSAPQPTVERGGPDLPSRTADNFFWLGRYAERLEQMTRVARCALRCLAADSEAANQRRIGPLARMLARLGLLTAANAGAGDREVLERGVLHVLFQADHPSGVRQSLRRIQLAAFSVRDRLSADTWRILNRLEPDARQRPGRLPLVQAAATLDALVLDLAAFSGMETENMTRGHGWAFLDVGRRLERGVFVARLMEAILRGGPDLELLLEPALEICDSVMTHRRRYFTEPRLASTLEVLVEEPANPRSLIFQLTALVQHAGALPTGANPDGVTLFRSRVSRLAEQLSRSQDPDANVEGPLPAKSAKADLFAQIAAEFNGLSDLLTQVYFSHVAPQVN